jgi:hypothetical protein
MNLRYGLDILKLIIIIINVSYFTGIVWLIFLELSEIFEKKIEGNIAENTDTFIDAFELAGTTDKWHALVAMYFSFTSLSTVGFGDFYPKSDVERLVGAFMIMFGVAIFSMFMGIFIEILEGFKAM